MPSSGIRRFRYDEESRTLFVTFTSGEDYAYFDVPPEVNAGFGEAFSKGTYFAAHIRDRYDYQRLKAVPGVRRALRRPDRSTGGRRPSSPAADR